MDDSYYSDWWNNVRYSWSRRWRTKD